MNKVNTLKEVLDKILSEMSLPDSNRLRKIKKDDLIMLHHTLGMGIRNAFLLWDGNINLAKDMNLPEGCHADEVSQAIIEALWKRINDEHV